MMPKHSLPFRALPAALLLLAAAGCTDRERQIRDAIPQVVKNLQQERAGDISAIVSRRQAHVGSMEVYVDQSLSMRSYDRSANAPFGRLLSTLDDFAASQVSFWGFGFPDSGRHKVERRHVVELRDSSLYSFLNNDYAELARTRRFDPSDGVMRLVITDLVQSSPREQARLGSVAASLREWVAAGGSFAILLYRNPYRGQYYSDLGPDPLYNCSDRPLAVMVFAPSPEMIDDLLVRMGPDLAPSHVVRTGGQSLVVRPLLETAAGTPVLRNADTTRVSGYASIPGAIAITQSAEGNEGYVPLQFEVRAPLQSLPWRALGPEGSERFLRSLRPEIRAWEVGRGSFVLFGEPVTPATHKAATEMGPVSISSLNTRGDTLTARFTVPLRRPAGTERHFMLDVAFRLSEQSALDLVPGQFSTDSDLTPDQCGRTLKLRRLVGTLMLENHVPGRLLMFTDWR